MPDTPEIDLSGIEEMGDDELDALATKLGLGPDESEDGGGGDDDKEGAKAGGLEEGAGDEPSPPVTPAPKVSGQELLAQFKDNPEAQELVRQQLNEMLRQASATADAKKEQEEFQKLVASGDYEEIGRRWVTAEQTRELREKAGEEASLAAYREIYGNLFQRIESLGELSAEEKLRIDHTQYQTDAEYVLALSSFITEKQLGKSREDEVSKRVDETLQALKNMKAKGQESVSTIPGGVAPSTSGPETSKSLIFEGYREMDESRSDERVLA